jgi:hypothetical protein
MTPSQYRLAAELVRDDTRGFSRFSSRHLIVNVVLIWYVSQMYHRI